MTRLQPPMILPEGFDLRPGAANCVPKPGEAIRVTWAAHWTSLADHLRIVPGPREE